LAVFVADPQFTVYKRATGVLAVFVADPQFTVYKRATGALAVFSPICER